MRKLLLLLILGILMAGTVSALSLNTITPKDIFPRLIESKADLTEAYAIFEITVPSFLTKDLTKDVLGHKFIKPKNVFYNLKGKRMSVEPINIDYIEYYIEQNIPYQEPIYTKKLISKTCYKIDNETKINESYDCSYYENVKIGTKTVYKKEWVKLNKNFKFVRGQTYKIKIVAHYKAGLGKRAIDWIPYVNLNGKILERKEWIWWNSSWNYKRPINVSVSSGSTVAGYQVKLNITYDSDMQSDFDDLRFTNGSENDKLPYWIEEKSNGNWAIVWVKIDQNITTSNYTIYMYYGNPTATSESNGADTFDDFDDFLGTSLDTNKWSNLGDGGCGSVSVSNSIFECSGTPAHTYSKFGVKSNVSILDGGHILEAKTKVVSGGDWVYALAEYQTDSRWADIRYGAYGSPDKIWWKTDAGTTGTNEVDGSEGGVVYTTSGDNFGVWRIYQIYTTSSTGTYNFVYANTDYSSIGTGSSSRTKSDIFTGNRYISLMGQSGGATLSYDFQVDWVRERKYTSTEPTTSIGAEIDANQPPQYSNISINPTSPQTYPIAETQFNITVTDPNNDDIDTVYLENNFTGTLHNDTLSNTGNIYTFTLNANSIPAGTYQYRWFMKDNNSNWNATTTYNYVVNKATTTINLYLNGAENNLTINYTTITNATATKSVDDGTLTLYRNGTAVSNPEITTLAGGYWNYTAVLDHENYTANPKTLFVTVNPIEPTISLSISPKSRVSEGTETNVSGTCQAGLTCTLYRNGVAVSNPDVQTLGVGNYTYVFNTTGNENYTAKSVNDTLEVFYAGLYIYTYKTTDLSQITENISIILSNDTAQHGYIIYSKADNETEDGNAFDKDLSTYVSGTVDVATGESVSGKYGTGSTSYNKICLKYEIDNSGANSLSLSLQIYNSSSSSWDTLNSTSTSSGVKTGTLCSLYENPFNNYENISSVRAYLQAFGPSGTGTYKIYEIYNPETINGYLNVSCGQSYIPKGNNIEIRVSDINGNYALSKYYANITTETIATINAYMTPISSTALITIYVKDETYTAVQDAVVYIQRFLDGQYITVREIKTDYEGKGTTYLVPYNEYYKFIVYVDGTVRLTTSPLVITESTVNLLLGATDSSEWITFRDKYTYSCSFNETTSILRCELLDTSGFLTNATLIVKKKETLIWNTTCNTSSSSNPVTLTCDLGNYSGNLYFYQFYAHLTDGTYLITSNYLDYSTSDINIQWGEMGLLLAFIMVGTFFFMGISPITSIIFAFLGIIVGFILNIIPVSMTSLIAIGVVVAVIIWAIAKK